MHSVDLYQTPAVVGSGHLCYWGGGIFHHVLFSSQFATVLLLIMKKEYKQVMKKISNEIKRM